MIPGEPPFQFPWPQSLTRAAERIRQWFGYGTDNELRVLLEDVWEAGYKAGQNDRERQLGSAGLIEPTPNPYWED